MSQSGNNWKLIPLASAGALLFYSVCSAAIKRLKRKKVDSSLKELRSKGSITRVRRIAETSVYLKEFFPNVLSIIIAEYVVEPNVLYSITSNKSTTNESTAIHVLLDSALIAEQVINRTLDSSIMARHERLWTRINLRSDLNQQVCTWSEDKKTHETTMWIAGFIREAGTDSIKICLDNFDFEEFMKEAKKHVAKKNHNVGIGEEISIGEESIGQEMNVYICRNTSFGKVSTSRRWSRSWPFKYGFECDINYVSVFDGRWVILTGFGKMILVLDLDKLIISSEKKESSPCSSFSPSTQCLEEKDANWIVVPLPFWGEFVETKRSNLIISVLKHETGQMDSQQYIYTFDSKSFAALVQNNVWPAPHISPERKNVLDYFCVCQPLCDINNTYIRCWDFNRSFVEIHHFDRKKYPNMDEATAVNSILGKTRWHQDRYSLPDDFRDRGFIGKCVLDKEVTIMRPLLTSFFV